MLTEEECKGIDEMRTREPQLTKGWKDAFLARFYFARKGNVDRAVLMFKVTPPPLVLINLLIIY